MNEFNENSEENDYHEMNKTFEAFILNIFKKWNINENLNEFDFYVGENLINDFKETIHNYIHPGSVLKIFKKMNKDLPKEDNIILSQEINGLWKFDNSKLSWFNFTKAKWNQFLSKNKNKIREIFKQDINEEAIFNLVVISFIMNISCGKMRYKLIIKKAIKSINKKWAEITEEKVKLFKENIQI